MKRFGDSVQYASQGTIADVFEAVERGRCQYGVVPFENSIAGSVVPTLDKFVKSKVKIRAETYLPVHHYLLSKSNTESIRRVYSHPVVSQSNHLVDREIKPRIGRTLTWSLITRQSVSKGLSPVSDFLEQPIEGY